MKIKKSDRAKIPCDICGAVPLRGLKLVGEKVHCADCLAVLHSRVAAHVVEIGALKMLSTSKFGDEKDAEGVSSV